MTPRFLPCFILLALAACSSPRESATPPSPAAASATAPAVTRRPLPEPAPPQGAPAPVLSAPAAGTTMPAPAVPPGAIYVCAAGTPAAPVYTAIEYADKVDALCRKHPEMGPCQYERDACRKKGGRVFAADGTEITLATEAEYDRKVRRVTFKAN